MSETAWREWFAWRPVKAALMQVRDPAVSAEWNWTGEPAWRLVWLETVLRRRRDGGWEYRKPARAETEGEFLDRQW